MFLRKFLQSTSKLYYNEFINKTRLERQGDAGHVEAGVTEDKHSEVGQVGKSLVVGVLSPVFGIFTCRCSSRFQQEQHRNGI